MRALLPLLASTLLTGSSAARSPSLDRDKAIGTAIEALHHAGSTCDWPEVIRRARAASSIAPRGSDAWLEAGAWQIAALYEIWQPDELERAGRDVLAALADRRRAAPDEHASSIGPVHPIVAGRVAESIVIFARLLQSRGHHEDALGHLRLLLDDLGTGPTLDAAGKQRMATLDAAHSLIALGRLSDARGALRSLCEAYPGSREVATASALLQSDFDGPSAYAGKYRTDTVLRERMLAVKNQLAPARARLAERLGWPAADIPQVPLGFADLPKDMRGMAAITEGDPRRPNLTPVLILFTEPLALDFSDPVVTLVHELGHAALSVALGPACHRMPAWMNEGICESLAGQHEQKRQMLLVSWLADDAPGFCSDDFWVEHPLVLASSPCDALPPPSAGLALELLVDRTGIEGLRALIDGIRGGRSWQDALRAVTGESEADYLAAAHEHALSKLEAPRAQALPQVRELVAQAGDPKALLEAADRVVAEPSGPIALGFALWQKARALAAGGRHGEALDAFRDLHDRRREHPGYVELARAGEAEALQALSRKAEARERLVALQRDAMMPAIADWARQQLSKLE